MTQHMIETQTQIEKINNFPSSIKYIPLPNITLYTKDFSSIHEYMPSVFTPCHSQFRFLVTHGQTDEPTKRNLHSDKSDLSLS